MYKLILVTVYALQTLLPSYVTVPPMSPTLFTPSPHTYVQHAITTLGVCAHTCGYWPHALQVRWV